MFIKQNCAQIAGTIKHETVEGLIATAKALEDYITDIDFDGEAETPEPTFPLEDPDQTIVEFEEEE